MRKADNYCCANVIRKSYIACIDWCTYYKVVQKLAHFFVRHSFAN